MPERMSQSWLFIFQCLSSKGLRMVDDLVRMEAFLYFYMCHVISALTSAQLLREGTHS